MNATNWFGQVAKLGAQWFIAIQTRHILNDDQKVLFRVTLEQGAGTFLVIELEQQRMQIVKANIPDLCPFRWENVASRRFCSGILILSTLLGHRPSRSWCTSVMNSYPSHL